MKKMKAAIVRWFQDEEGLGTLEILLIAAVLVAIAIVFRKWIISWVNDLFASTQSELDKNNQILPNTPP